MNRRQHVLSFAVRCPSPLEKTKIIHKTHTDIQVRNTQSEVQALQLPQSIAVQLMQYSLYHSVMHRKHVGDEATMCRNLSSPMLVVRHFATFGASEPTCCVV